jgi:hypothetical protein
MYSFDTDTIQNRIALFTERKKWVDSVYNAMTFE